MVESGIKELGAAILAGVVIVAVSDFIFMQASFGRWFTPAFSSGNSGMPAPVNPGTGGLPAGSPGGNGGALPDPTTC